MSVLNLVVLSQNAQFPG